MAALATNQTGEEHSCLILSAVAATLIASKKRRYAFFLLDEKRV